MRGLRRCRRLRREASSAWWRTSCGRSRARFRAWGGALDPAGPRGPRDRVHIAPHRLRRRDDARRTARSWPRRLRSSALSGPSREATTPCSPGLSQSPRPRGRRRTFVAHDRVRRPRPPRARSPARALLGRSSRPPEVSRDEPRPHGSRQGSPPNGAPALVPSQRSIAHAAAPPLPRTWPTVRPDTPNAGDAEIPSGMCASPPEAP